MVPIGEVNTRYIFRDYGIDQQIFLYGLFFKVHRTLIILARMSVFFAVLAVYWYLILTYVVGWYESSIHLLASVGSIVGSIFLSAQGKQSGVLEPKFDSFLIISLKNGV
ncbi:hypothetical protein HY772_01350 [Candidatus Woesearchaeota archaeon]|nr:hypothetical protein [Candidatus Woesearchaeota archaeon]